MNTSEYCNSLTAWENDGGEGNFDESKLIDISSTETHIGENNHHVEYISNDKVIDLPGTEDVFSDFMNNESDAEEILICEGCKKESPRNIRRRCTGGTILCTGCRQSPEYKILTSYTLKRRFPDLPRNKWPLPVGKMKNFSNPKFKPHTVYRWGDVMMVCLMHNISVPEYFFS